jgi:hypothetical protein
MHTTALCGAAGEQPPQRVVSIHLAEVLVMSIDCAPRHTRSERMFEAKTWGAWLGACAIALAPGCDEASELEDAPSPVLMDAGGVMHLDAALASDTSVIAVVDATLPTRDANAPDAAFGSETGPSTSLPDGAPGDVPDAGAVDPSTCAVQPIPEALRSSYRLGAIYKRYADARGVPVVAALYAILKEVLPDTPSFRDCYYCE